MPGKEPYTGTDSMSPSSTAVAPTNTVFPASIARGTRPSSTSTYETNVNDVGEIEKSMGTAWSSGRTRRGSMMLATRTPSIVQKLRHSRVRPSDPASPLTTARLGAAREPAQRLADRERAVGAVRALEEGGQQPVGKSRGFASAASSTASSRAFDCELKSISMNTLSGAARVSFLDELRVMAARPRPLVERREAGGVDADDHDVRAHFAHQQPGARVGAPHFRALQRTRGGQHRHQRGCGERDQPPAVTAADADHFLPGRRTRPSNNSTTSAGGPWPGLSVSVVSVAGVVAPSSTSHARDPRRDRLRRRRRGRPSCHGPCRPLSVVHGCRGHWRPLRPRWPNPRSPRLDSRSPR